MGRITLHQNSGKFPIKKAVRQGDSILQKLLTACLGEIFRELDWDITDKEEILEICE